MKANCLLILSIGVVTLGFVSKVTADTGTIAINPFSQVVTLQPEQPKVIVNFGLSNSSSVSRLFEVSSVDFGSLKETGGLIFSGENSTQLQKKYGLTKWIEIANPLIEVGAGKSISVPVTILNRDDLAPGGHYGAIIFREQATAASGQVTLHSAITSLMFVQKIGGEKYNLNLDSIKRDSNWWQSLSLRLNFRNNGNIDVVPRGVIRLLNPRGQEVARAAINEDSSRILPETSRQFLISLANAGKLIAPGKYQLVTQYRYDGQNDFTTQKSNLYYIPPGAILLLVGIVAALIAITVVLAGIYKRLKPRR